MHLESVAGKLKMVFPMPHLHLLESVFLKHPNQKADEAALTVINWKASHFDFTFSLGTWNRLTDFP